MVRFYVLTGSHSPPRGAERAPRERADEYPQPGRRFCALCYRFECAVLSSTRLLKRCSPSPLPPAPGRPCFRGSTRTTNANDATFSRNTVLAMSPGHPYRLDFVPARRMRNKHVDLAAVAMSLAPRLESATALMLLQCVLSVRDLVLKSLKASAILPGNVKERRVATVATMVRDEPNLKSAIYNAMSAQRQPPTPPGERRSKLRCRR
jgi:hypothetical protein